ncbi:carboxymuconolactone decarboxylase [Puniceibacterium sp. IMCC21224]|uniref:carboxymuconolactone decarboxylase n=1 Tax=Puniceibacterium sp. IMCC21224 TaxID=1618204 RepID=UPI00064D7680|nr:carboxymuconolactone decarboxylase [Puniceibacterium sp. IMCC21224]KMK65158.1 4-carboxymuconolactone decarboxylase [Puniceibacterium sp. IMCC21224]
MANTRITPVDPETASPEQSAIIAQLGAGRGRIPTPFNIWLHNPRLAEGMEIIGTHIDASPVLSEAESEVAILATAVHWNSPYVIGNHRRHALKTGVPEAVVEALLEQRRPERVQGRFGAICDAVCDIIAGGEVDDARFARYDAELGREVIAELLVTVGYFSSVSLAMRLHDMKPKG